MNRLIARLVDLFSRFPHSALALLGRLAIGLVFWSSGQTKLEGYELCIPAPVSRPIPSALAKTPSCCSRTNTMCRCCPLGLRRMAHRLPNSCCPSCLFVGLGTRFAALGLLGMTLVIQIFVYPGAYVLHGTWATVLIMLLKYGPGKIALDHLIWRR